MGRGSSNKRRAAKARTAKEAAAARTAQQRADQRRRAMLILRTVATIAVVAVVLVAIELTHRPKSDPAGDRRPAPASVVTAAITVSPSTLDRIGEGSVVNLPGPVTGEPALRAGGKPELLYIGAEFCPFCAIERWSLVEALSRFGRFSHLYEVRAGTSDGRYASLDFYRSSFVSKYLTFTAVENEDRNGHQLEPVDAAQDALWTKLDENRRGFPFVDFGNKFAITVRVPLDPTVLGSLDQQQVASQLDDPSSKIAQVIGGGANDDTAAICAMTDNQPANVCSDPVITGLEAKMNAEG